VGQGVRFEVAVEKAAYVGVWSVEADGTVLQLFPNKDDRNHHFKAGERRVVPAQGTLAELSRGIDQLWIEASTEPWNPLKGEEVGPFELFRNDREKGQWQEQRRGLRLRRNQELSECVLSYRVIQEP
jgi:hypothetical protein